MRTLLTTAGAVVAVAATLAGTAGAASAATGLKGTVSAAGAVKLTTAAGKAVGTLTPGAYTIVVTDRSTTDDFWLAGAGLSKATSVKGTGTVTWKVTLKAGSYTLRSHKRPAKTTIKVVESSGPALVQVNANTATVEELTAAFEKNGISSADRWAREVEEYRPYPTDDPGFAKLKQELSKYNPSADTLALIIASLSL